jgi:hypothetical protein
MEDAGGQPNQKIFEVGDRKIPEGDLRAAAIGISTLGQWLNPKVSYLRPL